MSQQIALGEKGELRIWLKYSETPPYGHLVITATFLAACQKPPYIFL